MIDRGAELEQKKFLLEQRLRPWPEHIRALFTNKSVNPFNIETGQFSSKSNQSLTLRYSFATPIENERAAFLKWRIGKTHSPIWDVSGVGEHYRKLILRAFTAWQTITPIKLIEDDIDYQLLLYSFKEKSDSVAFVLPDSAVVAMAFNEESMSAKILGLSVFEKQLWIFIHEWGHVLGLKHLFSSMPLKAKALRLTSFSVMNYDHEKTSDGTELIPATLMPADIETIERFYPTVPVNLGDTQYNFREYEKAFFQSTIRTIVDHGGNDTFSAELVSWRVEINLRPYSQSKIVGARFVIGKIDIENVITGSGYNDITLNHLNNSVVATNSKFTNLFIDTKHCGPDDRVYNFNQGNLYLQHLPSEVPPEFTLLAVNNGTKIIFDQNNALFFAGLDVARVKNIIRYIPEETLAVDRLYFLNQTSNAAQIDINTIYASLSDICSGFPEVFLRDCQSAFCTGALMTFVVSSAEKMFEGYGFTAEQIATLNQVARALMILCIGSYFSVAASYLTAEILRLAHIEEKKINIASTVVATTVSFIENYAAPQPLRVFATVAGSFVGSMFASQVSFWASKAIKYMYNGAEKEGDLSLKQAQSLGYSSQLSMV